MKSILFACLLVVVGSNAFPQKSLDVNNRESRQERIIEGAIIDAIREVSDAIVAAGLDPLIVERYDAEHTLVPFVLTISAFIDNLDFRGMSNIAVNRMSYSLLTNRLQFDISLPAITSSLGEAGVVVNAFGTRYSGSLSGNLAINQIRLTGDIRVNIGIISGITLRSISMTFRLGGIQSAQTLIVLDEDWSDDLNNLLNQTIPDLLTVFRDDIDRWITDMAKSVIEDLLSNSLVAKEKMMMLM